MAPTIEPWTLDELVERVAAALGDGYAGGSNGRVRDVPDARAIRWWRTSGSPARRERRGPGRWSRPRSRRRARRPPARRARRASTVRWSVPCLHHDTVTVT